jgi:DNA-binding NarL/FixJ family response regulator
VEQKTTVSILSKNRLLRESLARILTNKHGFEVADYTWPSLPIPSGSKVRATVDVWISDSLHCLADNGLPRHPDNPERMARCVLVAMPDDPSQFMAAVRLGVLGYVLQEASASDVVSAIRSAAQDEAVCPGRLTRVLFDFVASQKNQSKANRERKQFRLTRRERQLVPLVGRGLTNKEIAAALSVSEQTIKSHIHRMLRKVGVEDRFSIGAACEDEQASL